jgi:acylpyruvate hydrolase
MFFRIASLALSICALALPASTADYPDHASERRLRANTGDYLYKIAGVLEHFSRYVVFEAGDLIAMGAPSGVAVGQPNAAELYLQPGNDMAISFEGLMSLRTRIVAPG